MLPLCSFSLDINCLNRPNIAIRSITAQSNFALSVALPSLLVCFYLTLPGLGFFENFRAGSEEERGG